MSTSERRQHRRVQALRLAGHLMLQDEVVAMGLDVDDISLGGLFLRSEEPLPPGTSVRVELTHPQLPRSLTVTGRVVSRLSASAVRGARVGMGVRFDTLSLETLTQLSRMLQGLMGSGAAQPRPTFTAVAASATLPSTQVRSDAVPSAEDASGSHARPSSLDGWDALPPGSPGPRASRNTPVPEVVARGPDTPWDAPTVPLPLMGAGAANGARAAEEPASPSLHGQSAHEHSVHEEATSEEVPVEEAPLEESLDDVPVVSRLLMVQVKGLLMQVGEAQAQVAARDLELARLHAEVARLRAAVAQRDEVIRTLEAAIRAGR